jgi:hypothetical protein
MNFRKYVQRHSHSREASYPVQINYSPRKKKYQVWQEGKVVEILSELILRDAREINETWKKELSKERTEHLFLSGKIEREINYQKIKIETNTKLVYYPSKHKGFWVIKEGQFQISLEELTQEKRVDLLCRIVNYHPLISVLDRSN